MVHCLSGRHREIVAPTVHQGAAQPLAAQDGKWDKEVALAEPVWDKNNIIHKMHKMLHKLVVVVSSFSSVSYSVGFNIETRPRP